MTNSKIQDLLAIVAVVAVLFLVDIPYVDLLIAFVGVLIYSHFRGGIKLSLGFERPQNFTKTLLVSCGLGFVISTGSFYIILPVIKMFVGTPLNLGPYSQLEGNTSVFLTSLAGGWIVGGLMEETVFRSFLITKLTDLFGGTVGIVVAAISTSFLFGFLHTYQGPTGQVLVGIVGLIFAIIFLVNKRNIWLNIFTHGFVNTFSMLFLYLGGMNGG